jgi:hypothetical protein
MTRRQHRDHRHARGPSRLDTRRSVLEHDGLRGIDAEETSGAQIAGRVRLAVLDLLSRDEHVRNADSGRLQTSDGESPRPGGDDREAMLRDGLDELPRSRQRRQRRGRCDLLAIDPCSLRLGIEMRRHEPDEVDRPAAVAESEEPLGVEAVALRKCPPAALDLGAGVDEHAVEVGNDGARLDPETA